MPPELAPIKQALSSFEDIEFAVVVGSRASGTAGTESDWDIAIRWHHTMPFHQRISRTEELRLALAKSLQLQPQQVDLIDLSRANLAMRAAVAEEGIPITGEDTLAWNHFLQSTWRDLEDHYWDQSHAA